MITITKQDNSVLFEFEGNSHYLQEGKIEVPVNALSLVVDESDMATFIKAADGDIFISATYDELGMDKEALVAFYEANMVGSTGGGSGSEVTLPISSDNVSVEVAGGLQLGEFITYGNKNNVSINFTGRYLALYDTVACDLDFDVDGGSHYLQLSSNSLKISRVSSDIDYKILDNIEANGKTYFVIDLLKEYSLTMKSFSVQGPEGVDDELWTLTEAAGTDTLTNVLSTKANKADIPVVPTFKTINGEEITGEGDITVGGGGAGYDPQLTYIVDTDGNVHTFDISNYFDQTSYTGEVATNKVYAVYIGTKLYGMGSGAFSKATNLEHITIPNTCKTIGTRNFERCTNLKSVEIPTSINNLETFNPAFSVFNGCSSLEDVVLHNNIEVISSSMFNSTTSLKHISLPESVEKVLDYAFYNSGIVSITLPKKVSSIGTSAFSNCSSLKEVTIEYVGAKITYKSNAFASIASDAVLYVPKEVYADYMADSAWLADFGGGIKPIGKIWSGSQDEYDAFPTKYDDVIYFIK